MKNLKLKGTILKKSLSLFIILSCIMFISNKSYSQTMPAFSGGDGLTDNTAFEIKTVADMNALSTYVNGGGATSYHDASWVWYPYYFQMKNDIDFENNTFTPI